MDHFHTVPYRRREVTVSLDTTDFTGLSELQQRRILQFDPTCHPHGAFFPVSAKSHKAPEVCVPVSVAARPLNLPVMPTWYLSVLPRMTQPRVTTGCNPGGSWNTADDHSPLCPEGTGLTGKTTGLSCRCRPWPFGLCVCRSLAQGCLLWNRG